MKKLIELDPKPKTVAELYAIPGTWTKGALYRGANGNSSGLIEATCGCLSGALIFVYGPEVEPDNHIHENAKKLEAAIAASYHTCSTIPGWNDGVCLAQEQAREMAELAGV